MSHDEKARQRLVEIAEITASMWQGWEPWEYERYKVGVRTRAGFKDPSKGSWCAAGLTAAMEDAGLVVPDPGTPARRGSIALLDWLATQAARTAGKVWTPIGTRPLPAWLEPGDIIAWLQRPPPDPAGWRRGHVAVIVKVDDISLTTVGWNEGAKPGRVMKRRLWRDHDTRCPACDGTGHGGGHYEPNNPVCTVCRVSKTVPRSSTVLYRRPGGLYGIARPVAR